MSNAPIYYVGGSKGGVGKSQLSFALVDYLLGREKNVLLLETDSANPDLYKTYLPHENEKLTCKLVNLDYAEGWIELVNFCGEKPGHVAVVNSAARSTTGMERYGETLKETLGELERDMIAFWVINRQRDSVELLRSFLDVFPEALVHVCRNLYFGEPENFEMYNESKLRKTIEERGRTLDFPAVANRVADKLSADRLTIEQAVTDFPIGDRAELKRWRLRCREMFDLALKDEGEKL
jgi:hypothetical protein